MINQLIRKVKLRRGESGELVGTSSRDANI